MPNWCQNEVNIYGTEEELTKFKEFVRSKDIIHGKCSEKSRGVFNKETERWEFIDNDVYCKHDDEFKDGCFRIQEPLDFNSIIPMPIILEKTSSPPHVFDTQEEVDKFNDEHEEQWMVGNAITKVQLAELKEATGYDNWYDWCCDEWGTKWNCGEIDFEDDGDHLMFNFDTAWCPPYGVYNKLVEVFPDLSISWFYREEGQQFAGYLPE